MFRLTLITFSLGLIMIFGCNRSASTEATPPADTDVILKVPGMYWNVGWPDRVRNALATLPWVEHKSIQTLVPTREVRFDLADKKKFNEDELKSALKDKGFKELTIVKSVTQ